MIAKTRKLGPAWIGIQAPKTVKSGKNRKPKGPTVNLLALPTLARIQLCPPPSLK
jgi:hypothetical protein